MAKDTTSIRIDKELKQRAQDIFETLGIDLSSAVSMFLNQTVLRGGLPFEVTIPRYSQDTLEAIEEARKISRDDSVKLYTDMEEMFKDLKSGVE